MYRKKHYLCKNMCPVGDISTISGNTTHPNHEEKEYTTNCAAVAPVAYGSPCTAGRKSKGDSRSRGIYNPLTNY